MRVNWPNWSYVQHIKLAKLKQSVWAKEKKDERCTLLKGKGLGRHLTDKVFILSVGNEAREKEAKGKEKDQRTEAWKVKRAARDTCKEDWKQIKIGHDKAVEAWKMECEILKVAGTWPRDLPTKPKRSSKLKPVVEDELDDNEEDESYGDE